MFRSRPKWIFEQKWSSEWGAFVDVMCVEELQHKDRVTVVTAPSSASKVMYHVCPDYDLYYNVDSTIYFCV